MIDSHCHLDFPCFDEDRQAIVANCQSLGISDILIPGTQAKHWQRQIQLAQHYPQLHFALGLHPYFLTEYQPNQLTALEQQLSQQQTMLAVGEIGLDAAIEVEKTLQLKVFHAQLKMAQALAKPVIVHHRGTHNDIIRQLKLTGFSCGGIVHAFSGSLQQAQQYIDMGFLLGVGATITYHRAVKTRSTLSQISQSALALETDAPAMPVCGRQGQRNSPEFLPEVLRCLAQLRQQSAASLAQATDENVRKLLAI